MKCNWCNNQVNHQSFIIFIGSYQSVIVISNYYQLLISIIDYMILTLILMVNRYLQFVYNVIVIPMY